MDAEQEKKLAAEHAELSDSMPGIPETLKDAAKTVWDIGTQAYDELLSLFPEGEPGEPAAPAQPEGPSPRERVQNRSAWKRYARQTRLGQEPPEPPNLGEGLEQGERFPGFDNVRGANDVAGAFVTYQNQLLGVLTTMQRVLMESINRLEAIEAYFDRLR